MDHSASDLRVIEKKKFRVQGSGFRVQGSGLRVQGSGFGADYSQVDVLGLWYKRVNFGTETRPVYSTSGV